MLKPKNIKDNHTGAADLASMMAGYTTGMDVHYIELDKLRDAPSDWNFFRPLADDKFLELCESIEQNGLIHPIIVMQQDNEFIILSGHNRKRAFEKLLEATGDRQYARIACVIKKGLDEEEARSLLVDANWVQRELTPSERAKAILFKYAQMGRKPRDEESKGVRTYDLVAEHFGLKATQVYQYTKLAELPDEWLDRVDAGKLSIKAAVYAAGMDEADREELYNSTGGAPITRDVNNWRHTRDGKYGVPMRAFNRKVPEVLYNEIADVIDTMMLDFYKQRRKELDN